MAISAQDVKTLREMTNVGMMDCKKALVATDGDMDKAVEWLREKGLAAAAKKAGRIAAEGAVLAVVKDGVGAIVEVNAETDFASNSDKFQEFIADVADVIATQAPADMAGLMACTYPGSELTVEQTLPEKILVIGENIQIRRFERYETGITVPYVHMGGRIGVLVNLEVEGIDAAAVTELGKDIAMQAAAMNPRFFDKSEVSQQVLDEEKKIQLTLMANDPKMAGKPEKVLESIVNGKMNKFFEENCLMQQAFVKENKVSVEQHVAAVAKELGGKINVVKFVRFEKGEGIEKKVDDFAAEVAAAAGLK